MKKHTLLLFIALLMGVMSCLGPTKQIQSEGPAGRYYVKMDGNDEADGTSWETAFFSLQKALESAGPGYEIWVAAGSYKPTKHAGDESLGDGGRDNAFVLRDSVSIYGGFPATGNPGMDERDWKAFETILSGDIGVEGDIEDNAFHVLIAVNVSDKTLLDGFVITGGNASFDEGMPDEGEDEDDMGRITVKGQPISGENGGGMYNRSSSPTLHNLIFRDNKARLLAGGIYSTQASSPALYQVSLTRNSATWGGGMYNSTGAFPVLSHVSIYANKASWGGGMYNKYCSIVLTDVSIKGNVAEISGGGMGCFGSLLLITHTEIDGNTSKGHGGGLELQNSYPVFINVTIRGNEAQQGGGMNTTHSGPFLANVLISGNRSAGKGGGIHYYGSSGSMMNTTISGNMAGEGGGIFARANNFQHFSLYNTLVFGNSSGIVVEESKYPVFRSFSLIQGISAAQLSDSGEGNIDANQMTGGVFVAPASPEEAPTTKGDYRLAKGSAAINKGYTKDWDKAISYFQGALDNLSDEIFLDNAGYKHFLALREKKLKAFLSDKGQTVTDLKGNPRVAGAIDIGAYEHTGEERANAGQEDIQQEASKTLAVEDALPTSLPLEYTYKGNVADIYAKVDKGSVSLFFDKKEAAYILEDPNALPQSAYPVALMGGRCKGVFIGYVEDRTHPILCCLLESGGVEILDIHSALRCADFSTAGPLPDHEDIVSIINDVVFLGEEEAIVYHSPFTINSEGYKKEIMFGNPSGTWFFEQESEGKTTCYTLRLGLDWKLTFSSASLGAEPLEYFSGRFWVSGFLMNEDGSSAYFHNYELNETVKGTLRIQPVDEGLEQVKVGGLAALKFPSGAWGSEVVFSKQKNEK